MITLFRRIRKRFIESGSMIKYLLYALGEILLVVIGILIALQVNNWNEERIARAGEHTLLINVLDAVRVDSINFEATLLELELAHDVHHRLYRIHNGELPSDSLGDTAPLRRSVLISPVTNRDYPELANEVLNGDIKQAVLSYYQMLRAWQFIIDNYNVFVEEQMRRELARQQLLNFGYSFQIGSANSLTLINGSMLLQKLDDPDLQQLLFEGALKTQNLSSIKEDLTMRREDLKREIYNVLGGRSGKRRI